MNSIWLALGAILLVGLIYEVYPPAGVALQQLRWLRFFLPERGYDGNH